MPLHVAGNAVIWQCFGEIIGSKKKKKMFTPFNPVIPPPVFYPKEEFTKTWTKPRGRVEVGEGGGFSWGGVEGWGEKAYNCN